MDTTHPLARIMGGPVGLLLASGGALGLLLASGVLDAELGARTERFGIRCSEGAPQPEVGLFAAAAFLPRSRAVLAQMQPNAASEERFY
jgi:hypothetical protein